MKKQRALTGRTDRGGEKVELWCWLKPPRTSIEYNTRDRKLAEAGFAVCRNASFRRHLEFAPLLLRPWRLRENRYSGDGFGVRRLERKLIG